MALFQTQVRQVETLAGQDCTSEAMKEVLSLPFLPDRDKQNICGLQIGYPSHKNREKFTSPVVFHTMADRLLSSLTACRPSPKKIHTQRR
jgi:hypothetical protein